MASIYSGAHPQSRAMDVFPKSKLLVAARGNTAGCLDDFTGNETLWTQRRFVVKEYARTGKKVIGFAVICTFRQRLLPWLRRMGGGA